MMRFRLLSFTIALFARLATALDFLPCNEISRDLRFPCNCALGPSETVLDGDPALYVDCDRVVFPGDFPSFPYGAPVVWFRQRYAGHQSLPTQIFASSGLPLRTLDFTGNSLRRLTERVFDAIDANLIELRLADNLLGDTLNPIFSSSEFHGLSKLEILDLSGNGIKSLEEGILEGCERLQELDLDRNSFTAVPSSSLNGPNSLKIFKLNENRIALIKNRAFFSQRDLQQIDLSANLITTIEGGGFEGLGDLQKLILKRNRLVRFNSDVFHGAENLETLDLAENFIGEFPTIALRTFHELKSLNLSSNLIQSLDNNDLSGSVSLKILDLSRNNIGNISPGTFLGLKQLKFLDISVNSLRTIEDDAFEGLDNLETLLLKDNNILLIPASAVGRLPRLSLLRLDYNRVAALSGDILRSIAEQVTNLIIAKNVVRELPPATFRYFKKLQHINLDRNLITTLNSDAFSGLENTLKSLRVSQNRLNALTGSPLALTNLESLDLSSNNLVDLSRSSFSLLPNLKHLNLSRNQHLTVPDGLLHHSIDLRTVDLSYLSLKTIPDELFLKNHNLTDIFLQDNQITELSDNTFVNLGNLTVIDLSFNKITSIRPKTFVNVRNIKTLLLNGNQLSSFKGEYFNTGTGLELLDISDNQLSYLFPSSFRIHPRLKILKAAGNKFNFFPAELIATLQFLQHVDLSRNGLKSIEELDFARLPRLRILSMARNDLEGISEMAFHNSTQLQILDLSYNRLERLGDRTFEGLTRLQELNLEGNLLEDLPETIFERSKLQMLENIKLGRNRFGIAPLKALQRQYFFVSSVDLSRNQIRDIPGDDSIMVNIKKLDLSYNPLSEEAVANILAEPKTVRSLDLAGTNVTKLMQLETPFLRHLNLSFNNITHLNDNVFERTTLLETLDLSYNHLKDEGIDFPKVWSVLKTIQTLNLSGNPIGSIQADSFVGTDSLRVLSLRDLTECTRMEKTAFKSVPNLARLDAYNYPKLGYMDVQGLLRYLPVLETVNIETKDPAVGSDQLQSILHSRLKEMGLFGFRLHSVSSGILSGVKGDEVIVRLINTSLTSLPPTLFFSVPRSTRLVLDVSGSKLTTISPQLLAALDDRRGDLKIIGLDTNPILCDCGARALRRWLPSQMTTVKCFLPESLAGKLLVEIPDDELTCDSRKPFTTPPITTTITTQKTTRPIPKTTEPEIIWSLPSSERPTKIKSGQAIGNDDTLIIGIVGGVVLFIAILIIIICIIRVRMTQNQYRGGPLANGAAMVPPPPGSACTCSVKGGATPLYALPPYAATLPHKINVNGTHVRPAYSTMGRVPYYQNGQPYYIAYADEKIYR